MSPLLFSKYTDEMFLNDSNFKLFKYADDMALVGLFFRNDDVSDYTAQVFKLQKWYNSSSLLINVGKTKLILELILKQTGPLPPLTLCEQNVEVVDCFKYLRTLINCRLSFVDNVDAICKKSWSKRKLTGFGVFQHILEKVYISLIESILTFNISVWYGRLTLTNKNKVARIVQTAGKTAGSQQKSLDDLYHAAIHRRALSITGDTSHPLNSEFEMLPSGRRYRKPGQTETFTKELLFLEQHRL